MLTKKDYDKLCKILDQCSYIYYNEEEYVQILDSDFDLLERLCRKYEVKYPKKVSLYSRSLNIQSKDQYDKYDKKYIKDFFDMKDKYKDEL